MSGPSRFLEALARRPLVLDAAMGTRLIARGLVLASDDPALWNLDRPEDVLDVHRRDVEAGADAILTNTFGAHRENLARSGREGDFERINRRAVALAREAVGADRFVIGCLGPRRPADPKTRNRPDPDWPASYREQAAILAAAGVDALVLETHRRFDAERVAIDAVRLASPLPLIASLYDWPGVIGEGTSAIRARRLLDQGTDILGANCLIGMEAMIELAARLRSAGAPLFVKPSAGLPDGREPRSPESFAAAVPRLLALGVRLIGGCCGTTEAHVAALRRAIDAAMASGESAEWNIWRRADGPVGTPP